MKTQEKHNGNNIDLGEKSFYIDKYNNFDVFNPNLDLEPKIAKYKRTQKKFYYDNSVISESYGESNIEKCLITILSDLFYTAVLGYVYVESFSQIKFYLLAISVVLDFLTSSHFIYLFYNLKNEGIFQKVSINSFSAIDLLIFFNFLNKLLLGVLIYLDNNFYYFWCLVFFTSKLILDTYFIMISIKMFMLSPCMIGIQEFFQRLWNNVKYYILCCEVEEPDQPDYTKLEELESFY